MKRTFSIAVLLLVLMFAICVQPVGTSTCKQETISKAVTCHAFIVSENWNYQLLGSDIVYINNPQLPEIYRNLCVFDLPNKPAKSFRTDRTVIGSTKVVTYLDNTKMLAKIDPVSTERTPPMLC